jgi:hypothetical protein
MNTPRIFRLLAMVLLVVGAPALRAGEVIDRIVAIVNGHVILQSQLEDDLCFEALASGRSVESLSEEDRRSALNHLVDQELVREQTFGSDMPQASPEQVEKRIQEIRAAHPNTYADTSWQATLARYGFNERKLADRIGLELAIMREVDIRLRPSIQIENDRIEAYYKNVLLPELHKAGNPDVPLPDVSARIREILTQQKIDEMFESWLQTLRKDSKVRTLLPADNSSAAGTASK